MITGVPLAITGAEKPVKFMNATCLKPSQPRGEEDISK